MTMTAHEEWAAKWDQRADIYNRLASDMKKAGLDPRMLRQLVDAVEAEEVARAKATREDGRRVS